MILQTPPTHVPERREGSSVARPCTVCSHPNRGKIDEALLNGTANRAIARQYAVGRNAVDRHRSHIGTILAEATQRRAEIEENLADDLLAQAKQVNRDLRAALEETKNAGRSYRPWTGCRSTSPSNRSSLSAPGAWRSASSSSRGRSARVRVLRPRRRSVRAREGGSRRGGLGLATQARTPRPKPGRVTLH
jgi:hypothetical protein